VCASRSARSPTRSCGWCAGWALGRFVDAFLFQVHAHDPMVYAGGSAVLLVAGILAAARRAALTCGFAR
jgi:hypothetical protein